MYVVDEFSDEPIMLIDKHIGFDEVDGMGIDGALFQRELLYLDGLGKKRIQVWINSPGGVVVDGYNIYNAMLKTKTKVDTYNIGICASISAVIYQAGRKRYMADYSILMYHNPFGGDGAGLEAMRNSIVKMIAGRSGMDEHAVEVMMNRETFIDANEAYEMKLCDEVEQSMEQNKPRAAKNSARVYWQESSKIVNNLFKKYTTMPFPKVTNKLNLNEAASEDSIVTAIEDIQNKAKNADEEKEKMKKQLDKLKDEYDKMKAEYDKLCKDMKDAKDKADMEAENGKKEKAKNYVATLVKAGKVKNSADVIASIEAKFVADFDGTKAIYDSITLTKDAVDITKDASESNADLDKLPTMSMGVMGDMARIRNKFNMNKVPGGN